MFSNRRLVLAAVIAAAIAAAVLLRPKAVPVDLTAVVRGPLMVTVDDEGETRVRRRFVIAAPVSGRLERITLDEGNPVHADTVVARIHAQPLDPRLTAEASARLEAAQAARREAQARVGQANAALAQAKRNAERSHRLMQNGAISKEGLELADLEQTSREKELAAAEFASQRADHDVQAAQAALLTSGSRDGTSPAGDDTAVDIIAPVDGTVLRVFEESERVIAVGTPLLTIGDPHDLEIVVDVLSRDAVLIHPGSKMLIDEWGGSEPLVARVRMVEPAGFTKTSALGVEEQRVNIIADFETIPANLGDRFRVEARIVVWESNEVLVVPTSALFREQGQWTVFAVDGYRARHRPVEIGHIGATLAEVKSGLTQGEQVVVHPSDVLMDGSWVSHEK